MDGVPPGLCPPSPQRSPEPLEEGEGRASRGMGTAQPRGHAWPGPERQAGLEPLILGGSL